MLTALAALALAPAAGARAAPGQLDPAFAGGVVPTSGVQLFGAAERADGSVIASGTDGGARVLQYTGGGSLAFSAGGAGVVARGVAIDSRGNAVVAGGNAASGTGMVVERFSGGGLDSSFGSKGVVSLLAGSRGVANAVAVDPRARSSWPARRFPRVGTERPGWPWLASTRTARSMGASAPAGWRSSTSAAFRSPTASLCNRMGRSFSSAASARGFRSRTASSLASMPTARSMRASEAAATRTSPAVRGLLLLAPYQRGVFLAQRGDPAARRQDRRGGG